MRRGTPRSSEMQGADALFRHNPSFQRLNSQAQLSQMSRHAQQAASFPLSRRLQVALVAVVAVFSASTVWWQVRTQALSVLARCAPRSAHGDCCRTSACFYVCALQLHATQRAI